MFRWTWNDWGMDFQAPIGAKIGNPDTPVISISGDGGMQMNSQELATAVLEELPIISCVFNNSIWEWCVSGRNCSTERGIP